MWALIFCMLCLFIATTTRPVAAIITWAFLAGASFCYYIYSFISKIRED